MLLSLQKVYPASFTSGGAVKHVQKFILSSHLSQVGFRISPVTLEQHAGLFRCVAKARNGRTQNYTVNLSVLMNTNYVPPPVINKEAARLVRVGDDFTLLCSVTVDYGVMVELRWTTPSARAASEGRLHAQEQAARNLSIGGTHIKTVEQVGAVKRRSRKSFFHCSFQLRGQR